MRTRPLLSPAAALLLLASATSAVAAQAPAQAPASSVVPAPPPPPPPAGTAAATATPLVEKPATPAPGDATATPLADKPAAPEVTVKAAVDTSKGTATRDSNKDVLNVDFPDDDVRHILSNVADLFDLNLVIPESLQGKATVKLRGVTWRQIFEVVLTPLNYTYREDGNIIKIVSNDSLQQEPVSTDVFIINYARAAEIMPTITSLIDPAAGGKIVVDTRSNSLVITERPTRMNRIRPIIEQLDRATDQVMIESKFVEVTSSDVKNIGVNWSSLANYQIGVGNITQTFSGNRTQTRSFENNSNNGINNNNTSTTTANTNNNVTNGTSGSTTNSQNTGSTNTTTVTSTNGTPTNTSTTGTNGGLTGTVTNGVTSSTTNSNTNGTDSNITNTLTNTGNILNDLINTSGTSRIASAVFSASDFSLVLSALQTLQNSKIVSNPTVVTLNNTEATINVGQERPIPRYAYNDQRGTFEVNGFEYKAIGVNLKVTPQVNGRGYIKLTLEPEVSQSTRDASFNGANIPIVDTRKAKTIVQIKDGYTMGLGGMLQTQTSNTGTKVPVLGSIPGLGRLFRSDSKNQEITNLIIFITAKTISPDGGTIEQVFDSDRVRGLELHREDLPGYRDGTDPFLPKPKKDAKDTSNSGEKGAAEKSSFRADDSDAKK